MAPKKKDAGDLLAGLVAVEEEVLWPEEVAPLPDPTFTIALAIVRSHDFVVEGAPGEAEAAGHAAAKAKAKAKPKAQPGKDAPGAAPVVDDLPPLVTFNPCSQLREQLKDVLPDPKDKNAPPVDVWAKKAVIVDREELVSLAGEGGQPSKGLFLRAEREKAARARHKINEFRKASIAGGGEVQPSKDAEAAVSVVEQALKPWSARKQPAPADFMIVLMDYPNSEEEFLALQEDGVLDLVDAWMAIYFSGESCSEEEEADAIVSVEMGMVQKIERVWKACEPPQVLADIFKAVLEAPIGVALSSGQIRTVEQSQKLRPLPPSSTEPSPPAEAGGEHPADEQADEPEPPKPPPSVLDVVSDLVAEEVQSRKQFHDWMDGRQTINIPDMPDRKADLTCYEQMLWGVSPVQQDVPMLLHCLCEQVERTAEETQKLQGSDDGLGEDEPGNEVLLPERPSTGELPNSRGSNRISADGDRRGSRQSAEGRRGSRQSADGVRRSSKQSDGAADLTSLLAGSVGQSLHEQNMSTRPEEHTDSNLLYFLDYAACKHQGTMLPGEISAADEVQRLLAHLHGPGIRRSGLPPEPEESVAQRSAARNRMYPFVMDMPALELERILMLDEFEALLAKARPEQKCSFKDRVFHERIPKDLLSQVLFDAFSDGRFVDTRYIQRHDSLLIALYHRALPGNALWHLWSGDHLAEAPGTRESPCTTPSYNDWLRLASRRDALYGPTALVERDVRMSRLEDLVPARSSSPDRRSALISLDSRKFGYCRQVEKLLTPSDGSVIQQVTSKRGVAEVLPPAGGASAPRADEVQIDPNPEPQHEARYSFVQKNNVCFGMHRDSLWAERVKKLREEREVQEQKEREAAEAAAAAEAEAKAAEDKAKASRIAMGLEDPEPLQVEDVKPEVEEEAAPTTQVPLDELQLGTFWVSFRDGARCSIRVHHEEPWIDQEATSYDYTLTQPGMLFTYTMLSGLTIQVRRNGTVSLFHASGALTRNKTASLLSYSPTRAAAAAHPGSAEDVQVRRTVTPFGSLCVERLSGRVEVYHADGTQALRNPTLDELRKRKEEYEAAGRLREQRFLAKLAATCEQKFGAGEEPMTEPPAQQDLFAGLPGHWRVTRPDGQIFGRCAMPPPPPPGPTPEELAQMEEERLAAEQAAREAEEAAAAEAAKKKGKKSLTPAELKKMAKPATPEPAVEEEKVEEEEPTPPPPPPPRLDELIPGQVIEDGAILEYEIGSISATTAMDPHTWQHINMHAENMLRFNNADDTSRLNLCPDETRMSRTCQTDSVVVRIEMAGLPPITCSSQSGGEQPTTKIQVQCPDGAELEVVPKRVAADGELVACCWEDSPLEGDFCTNASVLLRRREGVTLLSRGSGDVDIATNGQQQLLSDASIKLDRANMYVARCQYDKILLQDSNGSIFEASGDQTARVQLPEAEASELKSPRCMKPKVPYGFAGQVSLPEPTGLLEPRLFVVYGDGEAEELLLTRDVQEALRLAKEDPSCAVVEGEPMGPPMQMCKSYSIYRTLEPPQSEEQLDLLAMPPIIEHRQRCNNGYGPPAPACTYMQWRNFVQYPPVTTQRQEQFRQALKRYTEWEERSRREAF